MIIVDDFTGSGGEATAALALEGRGETLDKLVARISTWLLDLSIEELELGIPSAPALWES